MSKDSPLISWLDHLWQLYPARSVLVVGAGSGASPWIQALQNWDAPAVTLVEADDTQFQHLQRSLAAREGWQLRKQVVATEAGSVTFHQASNPAESGLLEPEGLRALWPNLKTRHKATRQAIGLDELLAMGEPAPNWLLIDCLPADALLAGAGDALSHCDVIVTRALLPEADSDTPAPQADASAIAQRLKAQGFFTVATHAGRHPGVVHSLHVRDRTAQIEQLSTALTQASAREQALKESETQLQALQAELAQAGLAIQQAREEATKSQQKLAVLQTESTRWRETEQMRAQKAEAALAEMEHTLEESVAAVNERAAQLSILQQQIETIQAQLHASEATNSELRIEVGQLRQSLQVVEKALELAKHDAAQAIEREEQMKTDAATLTTDKTTLQKRAADLQRQVDQTMGRLAKLQLAHRLQARSLDEQNSQQSHETQRQPGVQPLQRLEPRQTANIALGDAWSGNTVNTVLFRHHGLLTWKGFQFTAFYADETTLRFVSRRLSDNDLKTYDLKGDFNLRDAHNSISMGVDNKGFLHVCFDHHASKLRYRRSLQPLSVESWTDDLPMTGLHEDKVTYPTFILPRAGYALTMLYRDGTHNRGSARLKYYDETNQVWRDKGTPILSGVDQKPWTSNAYWNHPAIGTDGSLHLSFVWRTGLIGEDQLVNNINVGYAWSPDNGHHWYSLQGQPYQVPITPVTAETIWPTPPGCNLINQCSMALDRYNMPHIAFYGNDAEGIPQYQHLWHDGKVWHHQFVSCRHHTFQLRGGGTLQIPISRPEILVDEGNNVYLIYRGDLTDNRMVVQRLAHPNYTPDPAAIHIIAPDDLGFSEPIIDRTLWASDQRLSIFLQHNEQPDGDRDHTVSTSPVWLVDLNLHP
ncbi:BNR-4 repeat-containing protein [Hydrogenophaga sp.]|uniref:BNR-4 repeat-containing protein n=1 Tax=Hydrogenophaga sp. TaxID=1904254 RepID=UPI002C1F9DDD|nr:BNR-4 repeat-containing protein [Hydrogenophaga sp.]HMP10021.1 BNR-4 repeat-containing protein [Hydrogenophaga sp.]